MEISAVHSSLKNHFLALKHPDKLLAIFGTIMVFCFLYFLHNTLSFYTGLFLQSVWKVRLPSPLLLFQACLLYTGVYVLGGWLFFYRLLPGSCSLSVAKKKNKARAMAWGFLGGTLLFVLLLLTLPFLGPFFEEDILIKKTELFRQALQKNSILLVWHLLFSAFVTAMIEEIFYRGCLQNYLEIRAGVFPAILVSTIAFALVHPGVRLLMLGPAFLFSILFWQQGLLASTVAHITYNSFILVATATGYG